MMNAMDLTGRVALVTGGASGIGRATAMALAEHGAFVALADLDAAQGADAAEMIGGRGEFHRIDVREEQAWADLIALLDERHGRLDILVNNAGIVRFGDVETCSLEDFRLQNQIMSEGVFLGCKHAIPLMARSGGGSIVNLSSMGAMQGFPTIVGYAAAKGAVRSMSKSIAVYCQQKHYGIRCNSVHPGRIHTGLLREKAAPEAVARREDGSEVLPRGSFGAAGDVAAMIVYLASPVSRYVTGAEFMIDNGATVVPID